MNKEKFGGIERGVGGGISVLLNHPDFLGSDWEKIVWSGKWGKWGKGREGKCSSWNVNVINHTRTYV